MAQVQVKGKIFVADGELFVPWGANYFVPGTGWAPQLWKKFTAQRAEADFALMASLGVNVVRVFGTWMGGNTELVDVAWADGTQFLPTSEEPGAVWNRDLVTAIRLRLAQLGRLRYARSSGLHPQLGDVHWRRNRQSLATEPSKPGGGCSRIWRPSLPRANRTPNCRS